MTEQRKYTLKVILAVVLILALPSFFFQYIGDNPLQVTENSTRTIAVVNEDNGVKENSEKAIEFGEKVTPLLQEGSDYQWTVLGRSAATSGLQNGKYDAVIYIPSTFSQNILSYQEKKPEKATLEYKVQSQLNAVNKEKVVGELEDATTKVNNEMSSLYWSYVSQEVDKVRGQFDKILNKEIAFQKTMVAFYKPNSKDLAGELNDQKKILQQIQDNVNKAEKGSSDRQGDVEQVEKNLNSFIEYVNQYQTYQETQKQMLEKTQAQSVAAIQQGLSSLESNQPSSKQNFNEQANQVFSGLSSIQQQLDENQKAVGELGDQQADNVSEQEKALQDLNGQIISSYKQQSEQTTLNQIESKLKPLRAQLETASSNDSGGGSTDPGESDGTQPDPNQDGETPTDPGEGDGTKPDPNQGGETPTDPGEDDGTQPDSGQGEGTSEPIQVDLSQQTAKLDDISKGLDDLEKQLQGMTSETPEAPEAPETPEDTETPGTPETPDTPDTSGTSNAVKSALEKVANLKTQVQAVKDELQNVTVQPETSGENTDALKQKIASLEADVESLTAQKNKAEKDLEEATKSSSSQIAKLQEENERLKKENEKLKEDGKKPSKGSADVDGLITMIKNKEDKILSSPNLSASRKEKLSNTFSGKIKSSSAEDLLKYYGDLSQYDLTLAQVGNTDIQNSVLNNDSIKGSLQQALAGTVSSQDARKQIQQNLSLTKEELAQFQSSVQDFADQYGQTVDAEQASIMEELSAIQEKANAMNQELQSSAGEDQALEKKEAPDVTGLMTLQQSMGQELKGMNELISSLGERQANVVTYTDELQKRVNEVQDKADTLNSKWAQNVDSTKLVRGQVYRLLNNTLVDGQNNDYVYHYLANPLQVSGEVPAEKVKEVPPVVILVIILISSLLIGYFSQYYRHAPMLVKGTLFGLLNLIVGLMVSIFSLNIYSLSGDRAMEWSIFTIVLLLASSTLVRIAFLLGSFAGWVTTVGLILFYITPLLNLSMPNFNYEDPVSKVYMSIQYDTQSLFGQALIVLLGMTAVLSVLPSIIRALKTTKEVENDETYSA
ncbi:MULTISPECIES: type VII secretion protein EsaA [Priestia]|uniref:Type VII secretion protein EsaA n=2 Tax=Priestia TaxID=2800373 RepID=A0AAX6BDS1_PRIMG|nr:MULTISPECIES: type VII secretion protein EsaA [Priestia]UPK49742.1 type VII secretion protein EsaA [Bacillus sp. H8-1]AWD65326.1 type VII secretion protein EsaA [Priestia megaterium]MDC7762224.1 type VII secretion protein EsaA [Priestia aryabhattai]MEB4888577.1 type VII secretion protein EsaA [Priestia megaterium]MED3945921.1 type VII secretion protein EsaA [Priestia aryabhattai]